MSDIFAVVHRLQKQLKYQKKNFLAFFRKCWIIAEQSYKKLEKMYKENAGEDKAVVHDKYK